MFLGLPLGGWMVGAGVVLLGIGVYLAEKHRPFGDDAGTLRAKTTEENRGIVAILYFVGTAGGLLLMFGQQMLR